MNPRVAVFFHAHPDDEALLTAGTMARLAAEGHRVVLVVATAGESGLAETPRGAALGVTRLRELDHSAAVLGCGRVVCLGYADSGLDQDRPADAFADADPGQAAEALAAVLREEHADLLTIYDPAGGYGHPDHVQVHRVGTAAARLAGTPIVLEATVDRNLLRRALRVIGWCYRFPPTFDIKTFERAYTPGRRITHRVNVRRFAGRKRASMAAHASQAGGADVRTLAMLLKIPDPLYRFVFGTEWYVRRDLPAGVRLRHPFDEAP
ncbi:N-acetylglucosaminyl deacetylase, LmbE family [Actinokineospora alba]|uniref:N-acetylglucosaminyl deacetylase, LmbE family n=1 Tax=Actinokineospora alba TaxID=504798 RepID=A0A1H0UI70_9PSEU|nr:PIG-L family deacetylase [Actinokineospora alba]TDP65066.1 LmbE family N-acetylglucosaminyl deacetylase [Actinokineospora alba]SDH53265.1 N-acetylglucosaminyl deacetylase, LmbE family [Actinokineospora alba]SDP65861.1 N-acetylglucosaminyl deacetylase, LmbE family [Actinokineospora alba]